MPTTLEPNDLHAKGDLGNPDPILAAESGSALDALLAEEGAKAGATPEDITAAAGTKPVKAATNTNTNTTLDDSAAAEKAEQEAAEKAAADKVAADKAAADKAAEEKAAADKAAAASGTPAAAAAPEVDPLDKIELPPHTSAKAKDSFATVKELAKKEQAALKVQIAERDAKLAAAQAEIEAAKQATGKLPEATEAELTELRQFKLAHEVESDPSFKEFSSKIENNNASIFKKLEAAGFTEEHFSRLREIGLDKVNWDPIFEKLSVQTQRSIEAKLVDNENLAEKREEALAAAKANASGFLKQRSEREIGELTKTVNEHIKGLAWTAEKPVPATATPEQKAALEAENNFARETMGRLKTYLADRSPSRFAELAVGTALAHKFKADLDAVSAKLAQATTGHTTALDAVTKERDALKAELDKIKRAAAPRVQGGAAIAPAKSKNSIDLRNGSQALDDMAKEYLAAQNA